MTTTRRFLAVVLVVAGVAMAALVGYRGYGPRPAEVLVGQQLTHLEHALTEGSDAQAQDLFPEGAYFNHVLLGLAEAGDPARLADARAHLAEIETPAMLSRFGSGMTPEHGAFAHGWSLSLATRIAETSRRGDDADAVRERAELLVPALQSSASGFLESYPGQFWPCDTVVAVSALARADALLEDHPYRPVLEAWYALARTRVDPDTGLLPHRVDADGSVLEGPRGSSQSIVQVFWPDIAEYVGGGDPTSWQLFTETFVVRRAGLVGVREYPRGDDGAGDVDSGPLVLGVSASASAVTLAAARRVGDDGLAASLDRECELLGLPLGGDGGRRYLLGQLPVGEAFVAWARSVQPLPRTVPVESAAPRPWWPVLALPGLLIAVLGVALWPRRRAAPSTS